MFWRSGDAILGAQSRQIRRRFKIDPLPVARTIGASVRQYRRWESLSGSDPRHPFPIADRVSRTLGHILNSLAIEQLERNADAITAEQRVRMLAVLGVTVYQTAANLGATSI